MNNSLHAFKGILHFAAFLLLLCSCGQHDKNELDNVFCYNESNGISSLDPAFARDLEIMWATNQLFDGLVELDSNMTVQPCIASSWEISGNGKVYKFHLRNDVFFHNSSLFEDSAGRKVTAADFVYSFQRILDPRLASPGQWIFSHIDTLDGSGFFADNDSTLTIKLLKPFAPFLGMLAMQYCNVVPKEVVDHFGADFRNHPIGTGPFRFAFWYENVALVLHRNPMYFLHDEAGNALPYLDAVKIDFVKDMSVEFQGLLQGKYDFMSGLHSSFKDELLSPTGELNAAYHDKLRFQKTPFIKTDYLGIMVDPALGMSSLQDHRVRQALCYAINRVEMVEHLRNNSVFVADRGFVPPGLNPVNKNIYYPYDPVRASQLLDEAGYKDRSTLPEITVSTTSDYVDLIEYIQFQWGKVGIKCRVEVMQGSTFREATANGRLMVFRKSWLADYADPENFLSLFSSKNFCPDGPNYTHYHDTDFDKMYDTLCTKEEGLERQQLVARMDSLIMAEMPLIPLYYDQVSHFVSCEITGLTTNPVNMLDLKSVRKSTVKKPL